MDTPLGKGLESLIPDRKPDEIPDIFSASESEAEPEAKPVLTEPENPAPAQNVPAGRTYSDHFIPRRSDSIFWIEMEKIEPNPFQPRREFSEDSLKELASSIREHGVLQPVLVIKREIETPLGIEVRYQLIAGERRWRAAKIAGLSQMPAVIRRGMPDDRLKLELALIENIQREDLNPIDQARAYKRLIEEFKLIQREIAVRIGKSRENVANTLRLLSLPAEIQQAVLDSRISEGHARAVLMAGDEVSKQMAVFHSILDERLNVRETENRARQIGGKQFQPKPRASKIKVLDPETREWQTRLEERLGTKVHLQRLGERGKIIMEFYSEEELRGLLNKLVREV